MIRAEYDATRDYIFAAFSARCSALDDLQKAEHAAVGAIARKDRNAVREAFRVIRAAINSKSPWPNPAPDDLEQAIDWQADRYARGA